MANQKLFETLINVCDFVALDSDLLEIIDAVDKKEEIRIALCDFHDWLLKDERLKYNGVPTKMNIVDFYLSGELPKLLKPKT